MATPKKGKVRRSRISQSMLRDEAEARIELGLSYLAGAAEEVNARLELWKSKDLARKLGVPEPWLELLQHVMTARAYLRMSVDRLQGGMLRLNFDTDLNPTASVQQVQAGLSPPDAQLLALYTRSNEPMEVVLDDGYVEAGPPASDRPRPTLWDRVANDEELV